MQSYTSIATSDDTKLEKKAHLIKTIVELCGRDSSRMKKPLHVAIVGPAGVGKSAFVNTIAAAFDDDRWREYAYSGSHGNSGEQITVFTNSYKKCCKADKYKDALLPTLIDVAGFHDETGEQFVELLRILFYGRLPVGESLAKAAQYYKHMYNGLHELRTKYSENNEKLKVDRVIFVTSATQLVPKNLIQNVIQAARPSGLGKEKRTIPIYGVMLKYDKVISTAEYDELKVKAGSELADPQFISEDEYAILETKFIQALGLEGSKHRFLRCSNYCDDVDPDNKRIESVLPDLDIPVLRFMTQVADPVMEVANRNESYGGRNHFDLFEDVLGNHDELRTSMVAVALEGILIAFILILFAPIDLIKLGVICKNINDDRMGDICEQLQNSGTNWLSFFTTVVLIASVKHFVSIAIRALRDRYEF